MKSIMSPEPPTNDLLRQMMLQLSPAKTSQSLSQQVAGLSQAQQQLVISSAKLLKMGMAMQSKPISWASLIQQFYPNLGSNIKSIIAAVLQESDPKDVVGLQRSTVKADAQAEFLEGYASKLKPAELAGTQRDMQSHNPVDYSDAYPEQDKNKAFLNKLAMSESSGDPNAEITIKDGRKFTGALQFGAARLADYKTASGKHFTQDEFKADSALQDKVAAWHIADIDKAIDALGDKASQYNRNGLRAVAHLSGKGGMAKYVQSGGTFNPSDELNTSLQDYYDKFSG